MSDYWLGVLMGGPAWLMLGVIATYCWYWWTEVKRRRTHLRRDWKQQR